MSTQSVSDSTAQAIITLVFGIGAVLLVWLYSICRGAPSSNSKNAHGIALSTALLSIISTCSAYWVITTERLSVADYEFNTTFALCPFTYVLQMSGMALSWLALYLSTVILLYQMQAIHWLVPNTIYTPILLRVVMCLMGLLCIGSLACLIAFWRDSYKFGGFAVAWFLSLSIEFAVIASTAYAAVHRKFNEQAACNYAVSDKLRRFKVSSWILGSVNLVPLALYASLGPVQADPSQWTVSAILAACAASFCPLALVAVLDFITQLHNMISLPSAASETELVLD
ncbi:hypothetical protein BJ741DRAFT_691074 [Chytriomyces cf. hyalinus JEL632]|nr:hypothetical protein BJ741DRAFT_691074 [Chytriomyces cf. hyalinus JEL632]